VFAALGMNPRLGFLVFVMSGNSFSHHASLQ
jgi:hypothetical protein